ncbi:MAG: N-6 DNA methylase [Chloroflexota bacterium]
MALKKSELYSSLWQSCDELRGGMDASQYKDYVLVMLFIKYVSDKYAGDDYAPIVIPEGASFADMVALKGSKDIGDQINKRVIAPLARDNRLASMPDFNDASKLGSGKEMVDRLTNLIAIFENPALDFSKNRADGDDILGDAYEYLMRHFATESGKSKGQFYTPAEVSRVIAQIMGIREAQTTARTTVYDPTCGSGSLLLKVADEATTDVTLYGQEKDAATSGLAYMNMILHNHETADILQGNTLAAPKFLESEALKTFDYVVANPPFSDKRWSNGLHPAELGMGDTGDGVTVAARDYGRFTGFGVPPSKQGDYAYLLHIVRSLKSTGKGACILPHGVLFRGNAEAEIRRNLIRKGYIEGIIGLPANLFYGTGIPACIIVLNKRESHLAPAEQGIFMVDASKGFVKDGPKNRLRAQDIHKIVDVFTHRLTMPGYARHVTYAEIERNEFNLNLPRYIDSQEAEEVQDIGAHLAGGIPLADVDALDAYWQVCPTLKDALFVENRTGYVDLNPEINPERNAETGGIKTGGIKTGGIKTAIYTHPEFSAFVTEMNALYDRWQQEIAVMLKGLTPGVQPKTLIAQLAHTLLAHYAHKPLIDKYDVYQHLMDYWDETMQDDCYLIAGEGWRAVPQRITERDRRGKEKDKGWTCDLVPKSLVVARYFAAEQQAIDALQATLDRVTTELTELVEEQSGDEGALAELEKVNKATITARLKEIKRQGSADSAAEQAVLTHWLDLNKQQADLKRTLKEAETDLDEQALRHYATLTEEDVKTLVVDDKWFATLAAAIQGETDRVSQALTTRITALADRYATPLSAMTAQTTALEAKVYAHLERMGFQWN